MPGRLSVLIVTHRREKLLERCLRSTLEAAVAYGQELELVVDVNGKDQESTEALKRFEPVARSLGIAFRHREVEEALSPAGARNRALADARGEWVFFADDDIVLPRGIFTAFARLLERFPDAIALGGPNLTPPGSSIFQRASGLALASKLATWQSQPRYRASGEPRACGEESLILCNLFVKRGALGGSPFHDTLKCGEENWLIRHLSLSGKPVIYAPELSVWHERRKTLEGFARQLFWYGYGRGQNLRLALGEKRPGSRFLRYFLPSLCVAYAVVLSALALAGRAPGALALPFAVYAVLCFLAAAASSGTGPERAISAVLFPVIHSFYGVGVIFGIARRDERV
jgi:glycosyltransferase involved in cell wall biosynthesis